MSSSTNIFSLISHEARNLSPKTAVIEGDLQISYSELFTSVESIVAELKTGGVSPWMRVGLLAEDSIDYIVISLAILSLNAVIVPISPEQSTTEREQVIRDIDCELSIVEQTLLGENVDEEAHTFTGLSHAFHVVRRDAAPAPEGFCRLKPAFIRFSSGTTGASKGVILSHRSIIERTDAADQGLRMTDEDTVLWVLSMSYHFVVTILLFLRRGATIILCGQQFPERFIDGIIRDHGTFIYASPFHYDLLSRSDAVAGTDLHNVRMAVSTAMKLQEPTAEAFAERFGLELTEAYGIIEVGLPFQRLSGDSRLRGSVGRPLPGFELKIDRPDAQGVGSISIRGPGMLDAYYSPWQLRRDVCSEGWFATGDLGRVNRDGCLFIVGREKSVINFVGMKVFPQEVEAVINQHPDVRESLVYGLPHHQYGELPVARIVAREETHSANLIDELRRFCYQKLAQFKVPKDFSLVDHLEKTASGKLKR